MGVMHKLETPKPTKKSLVPFSTPGGGGGGGTCPNAAGRIFGRRLTDLSQLLVGLDDFTDILVPKFVVGACTFVQVRPLINSGKMGLQYFRSGFFLSLRI